MGVLGRLTGDKETGPEVWGLCQVAWLAAMASTPWWAEQTGHFWPVISGLILVELLLAWLWAVNQ